MASINLLTFVDKHNPLPAGQRGELHPVSHGHEIQAGEVLQRAVSDALLRALQAVQHHIYQRHCLHSQPHAPSVELTIHRLKC